MAEIAMGTAVANWLADDHNRSLTEYQTALDREPAWKNAAWYQPQYSATVSRTITEMKAEADRRKQAAENNPRQAQ
jgi:hypothetical protein